MKQKPFEVVIVDLARGDRRMLIDPQAKSDLLNPPPVISVWDNMPGQEAWWKTIAGCLVLAAAFYIILIFGLGCGE